MAENKKTPVISKKKAVQMPSKKTMNFARRQSNFNPKKVIPIILVILIVAAVFVKFGVMDPLDKKTAAHEDLSLKQIQLAALNAQLTGYEELEQEYGRYSYGWMNETEISLVSRIEALNLVEKQIANKATIKDMAINNNVLTLNIYGITLKEASDMVAKLEMNELVESAAVYNATAEDAEQAEIFMSIILTKEAE